MNTNNDRRRVLKEQYINRHPDMGIVAWKFRDKIWFMSSKDTNADFNSTSFQLKLGTWINKEMQNDYNSNSDEFVWSVEEKLDYKDLTDDIDDDLFLMLMDYIETHPTAIPMKPIRKR